MNQLMHAKYSVDRAECFQIRTDILMEDEKKIVRKVPQTESAKEHIEKLKTYYELLKEDFAGTPLEINICEGRGDGAYFQFVYGKSLEEQLDELLENGQQEEMKQLMWHYFSMLLKKESLYPFEETEAFREVFGTLKLTEPLESRRLTDIDMIFSNIITEGGHYHLLDYEWTFLFPVPVKFIIYRCLNYYILGSGKRLVLSFEHYLEEYGFSEEEQTAYAAMEEHFQKYVMAGTVPMREVVEDISAGYVDVHQLLKKRLCLQIYRDYGNDYSELEMEQIILDEENPVLETDISLTPELKNLRIDPLSSSCIFEIRELSIAGEAIEYTTNGIPLEENFYLSKTEDPQILIALDLNEPCSLHLHLCVGRLEKQMVEGLEKQVLERLEKQMAQKLAASQPNSCMKGLKQRILGKNSDSRQ